MSSPPAGGDDFVDGGRGGDDISGGVGGDELNGGGGPDDIDGGLGTTDDASDPLTTFFCQINDASTQGTQTLLGDNGNDDLDGGRDNDLLEGDAGRNDLSGNGGDDCLLLSGDENERVSGGNGDDVIFADDSFFGADSNGDDIFCGAGIDTVLADAEDQVAADCEHVFGPTPPPLQAPGATPVAEVTITTPEGTTTMTR
jgi:Ca2+-binding RTX toxin-like protein